jgi:glycogen synthase kinase 3 beta
VKTVPQNPGHQNRELDICRALAVVKHPYIIDAIGVYHTADDQGAAFMNLVMEYVPLTLSRVLSKLRQQNMRLKEEHIRTCMRQLAAALQFMHGQSIAHRDLQPDNILIDTHSGRIKLADFGSAKRLVAGSRSTTYIGSRFYRAPELILDRDQYGVEIDMWSYGCILAELTVGTAFFAGQDNVSQLVEIIRVLGTITQSDIESMPGSRTIDAYPSVCRGPKPWPKALTIKRFGRSFRASYGLSYENLLDSLLRWQPSQRLTAREVIEHPFFDVSDEN